MGSELMKLAKRPALGPRGDITSKFNFPKASTSCSEHPLTNYQQQAFEGLENAGRKVRRPDCTLATTDHVCIAKQMKTTVNGGQQSIY
jgi:hypothetical protein